MAAPRHTVAMHTAPKRSHSSVDEQGESDDKNEQLLDTIDTITDETGFLDKWHALRHELASLKQKYEDLEKENINLQMEKQGLEWENERHIQTITQLRREVYNLVEQNEELQKKTSP